MKKVIVTTHGGEEITIEAPEDKEMAIDQSLLQHGVLALGEYGTSGIKIAAFRDWRIADFGAEGYVIRGHPF